MIALTDTTAVNVANEAYEGMGFAYPWSFVAIPSRGEHKMRLRLIQVEEGIERAEIVSYAKPVHGFSNECRRALRDLSRTLRDEIAKKRWDETKAS